MISQLLELDRLRWKYRAVRLGVHRYSKDGIYRTMLLVASLNDFFRVVEYSEELSLIKIVVS